MEQNGKTEENAWTWDKYCIQGALNLDSSSCVSTLWQWRTPCILKLSLLLAKISPSGNKLVQRKIPLYRFLLKTYWNLYGWFGDFQPAMSRAIHGELFPLGLVSSRAVGDTAQRTLCVSSFGRRRPGIETVPRSNHWSKWRWKTWHLILQ